MRYFALAILCGISGFGQAPAPAPKPDGQCSVEGQVLNEATGEPIRKARVTLWSPESVDQIPYGTTSDASGHFLIDAVDAGPYKLRASRSGYLNPADAITLTLESAQKLKQIVVKLVPQGVITGRVLDQEGNPLLDIPVECMSFRYEHGKRQLQWQAGTQTDDLGEFRLIGLQAGKCIIRASRQSHATGQIVEERPIGAAGRAHEEEITTYYPNTTNPNSASIIEVTAGAQIHGINIALLRAATVHIKGRVIAGTPIDPAKTAAGLFPRGEAILFRIRPMEANVDSQGRFQLDDILPGSYALTAASIVAGKRYSTEMPIEVRDTNLEGIELTVRPPAEIHGRVVIEGKSGLKGLTLPLMLQPKVGMGGRPLQVKDDLTFTMAELEPARYELLARDLPGNFYLKSVRMGRQDVTWTGIDLTQGGTEDVTIVLSANGGFIEGSVKNAKGGPANGVLVTLIPGAGHRSVAQLYKTINTDQNGCFIFKGITPGEYKLYAWEEIEEGAYEDPDFIKPHESEGEAVSIQEGSHDTVKLKAIPSKAEAVQKPAQ